MTGVQRGLGFIVKITMRARGSGALHNYWYDGTMGTDSHSVRGVA